MSELVKVFGLDENNMLGFFALPDLKGDTGKSAYDIAKENGFSGTVEQWLASLIGKGEPGKSAYEIAKNNGFLGSEQEWLTSLKGKDGKDLEPAPPVINEPKPEPPSKVFNSVLNTTSLTLDGKSFVSQNAGKDYSLKIESAGTKFPELVFEVRKGDEWPNDAGRTSKYNRSELYAKSRSLPFKTDVWVSFALLIEPGEMLTYEWPKSVFFINQFKANIDKGDHEGGPSISFSLHDDCRVQLNSSSTTEKIHTKSPETYKRAEKVFTRGEWINMVLRVVLDPTEGQLQWWANSEEICNLSKIGTCFNDDQGPYWKFGLYRPDMQQTTIARFKNVELNSNGSLIDRVKNPKPL